MTELPAFGVASVTLQRAGSIAEVVLESRPVNALTLVLLEQLEDVIGALPGDASSVLIRSAVPGIFMAGGDLEFLAGGEMDQMIAYVGRLQALFRVLAALPVPVVCCVEGHCLGGGLELALWCDLIVATGGASFGLPEARLGIIPAAGGVHRLMRRVGDGRARRLLMTGVRLSAAEALGEGLIDYVFEGATARTEAGKLAQELGRSGYAIEAIKRLVSGQGEWSTTEALEQERAEWARARATPFAQRQLEQALERKS
jgi:enoyl-CoA hydratase/carnithine racemase